MKAPPRRQFLARDAAWMERVRVYRTNEALEVAHISYFDVSLTRVFFDEVRLVTLHRSYGGRVLWLLVVLTALCGVATLAASSVQEVFPSLLAVTLAVGVWMLITAALPRWTVTVYGKRARARMRFPYRGAKARRIYDDLCQRVARAIAEKRSSGPPSVPAELLPPAGLGAASEPAAEP